MSRANSLICTTASWARSSAREGEDRKRSSSTDSSRSSASPGTTALTSLTSWRWKGRSRAVQAMLNARWRLAIEPMSMVFSQNGKRNRALPAYRTTRKKTEPMMLKKR